MGGGAFKVPLWSIWLIACAIFLVIEIFTVGFLMFFPAVGAFFAFLCAIFKLTTEVQIIVFAVTSTLMIIFIRPIVTKFFKTKDVNMNSKSVIGKNGIVIKEIDNLHRKGQVKVVGEIWSAISDSNEPIEEGATILVDKIDGVKLVVRKV